MLLCSCNDLLLILPILFVAPSVPQQMKIVAVTSTSVTLQWRAPKYPNGVITKYSVHCNGIDIDEFGDVSDKMIGTIEGLSPDTSYVIKLKAYTRVGPGLPVRLSIKTRKLVNGGVLYFVKVKATACKAMA